MYNKCRLTEEPINSTYWPKADDGRLCQNSSIMGRSCPDGQYCGNPSQFNIDLKDDDVYYNYEIYQGVGGFDNLFQSFLAIFQLISKDSWAQRYINVNI